MDKEKQQGIINKGGINSIYIVLIVSQTDSGFLPSATEQKHLTLPENPKGRYT